MYFGFAGRCVYTMQFKTTHFEGKPLNMDGNLKATPVSFYTFVTFVTLCPHLWLILFCRTPSAVAFTLVAGEDCRGQDKQFWITFGKKKSDIIDLQKQSQEYKKVT